VGQAARLARTRIFETGGGEDKDQADAVYTDVLEAYPGLRREEDRASGMHVVPKVTRAVPVWTLYSPALQSPVLRPLKCATVAIPLLVRVVVVSKLSPPWNVVSL